MTRSAASLPKATFAKAYLSIVTSQFIITLGKKYFVTAFDLYSLKRGLEILAGLRESIQITKVLFSKNATKEEDEYLNYLALGYKISWSEERIYFPFDTNDQSVLMENQRVSKVKLKKLSTASTSSKNLLQKSTF